MSAKMVAEAQPNETPIPPQSLMPLLQAEFALRARTMIRVLLYSPNRRSNWMTLPSRGGLSGWQSLSQMEGRPWLCRSFGGTAPGRCGGRSGSSVVNPHRAASGGNGLRRNGLPNEAARQCRRDPWHLRANGYESRPARGKSATWQHNGLKTTRLRSLPVCLPGLLSASRRGESGACHKPHARQPACHPALDPNYAGPESVGSAQTVEGQR